MSALGLVLVLVLVTGEGPGWVIGCLFDFVDFVEGSQKFSVLFDFGLGWGLKLWVVLEEIEVLFELGLKDLGISLCEFWFLRCWDMAMSSSSLAISFISFSISKLLKFDSFSAKGFCCFLFIGFSWMLNILNMNNYRVFLAGAGGLFPKS